MHNVVTVVGIRPDFIRMKEIFRRLDESDKINHIMIHTGQHFDKLLSDVFFDELEIRQPDYNLGCGAPGKEHFELSGDITKAIINLLRSEKINPDLILFLGDTNSVVCAVGLKKEGYRLGHIEAGMRSYDRRMLEEINRVVCDHCCDMHFVYHENYKEKLLREGIPSQGIYVVGNTIREVCDEIAEDIWDQLKLQNYILMDIHRPENFNYPKRLEAILRYACEASWTYQIPVHMVGFKRTLQKIKEYFLGSFLGCGVPGSIHIIDLMSYKQFLRAQYHSKFVISDSGTAQEEAPLLDTPVIVPRDFTERPESMDANCSYLLEEIENPDLWDDSYIWLNTYRNRTVDLSWLGDGQTAARIVSILEEEL